MPTPRQKHVDSDSASRLKLAQSSLLAWYKTHGRHALPWRITRDPYAIYLSEIMLQQTQVSTVLSRYYPQFLQQFPTLSALARAPLQDVMKAWEGLGYYTRAANLHKAANVCKGGKLPSTVEGLIELPGIGRNTAHAVASFAFDVAVPVMEANVKRVIYRLCAWEKASDDELWQMAETLLTPTHAFDHNQAMMDIGALVCTKTRPRCGECPLAILCKGKEAPERYPVKKMRKETPIRRKIILVLTDTNGNVYVKRRTERFLGGLYSFLEFDADAPKLELEGKALAASARKPLGQVTQTYSHFTLEAQVYAQILPATMRLSAPWEKMSLQALERLPLSRAETKIVELLKATT